jgi:hypothetical protein
MNQIAIQTVVGWWVGLPGWNAVSTPVIPNDIKFYKIAHSRD